MLKKIKDFFSNAFSFEKNVNLTDDTQVLYRRNVVIKNVIFLSNNVYFLIMLLISSANPEVSNIVITTLIFPLTFLINNTIKKMINKGKDDYVKQEIAMYISSFYVFLSALLIFVRLAFGAKYLIDAGYLLIFYSLAVISLYQNSKVIKNLFPWIFVIVTILNFTVINNLQEKDYTINIKSFLKVFFTTNEFRDIFLRSVILIIYIIVLYTTVKIGEYMHEKRKEELVKRREVQNDFSNIVVNLFNIVLNDSNTNKEEYRNSMILYYIVKEFLNDLNLKAKQKEEILNYSIIHINQKDYIEVLNNWDKDNVDEIEFEEIKKETKKGSLIIKRLQLSKKCETIVRAHVEGYNTMEFMNKMNEIQNDLEGQIILLSDLYITLRSSKSYKRPYPHSRSIELLETEFKNYFDKDLFAIFLTNNKKYELIYNNEVVK